MINLQSIKNKTQMKKVSLLVVLFIIGFNLSSCSSDDDNNEKRSKEELLIGEWKKNGIGVICASGSESFEAYSGCKENGSITFNADGTYNDIPYIQYMGDCIIDGESNGTWEFIDDELYIRNSEETTALKASLFEISESSLKLGADSNPCDGEDTPSIEYIDFSKI